MPDSRFFSRRGPFALSELAVLAEAELDAAANAARVIRDVAPLGSAGPDDIAFLDNTKYVSEFLESAAGACIASPAYCERAPAGMNLVLSATPYRAYGLIAAAFYPPERAPEGRAPAAQIDPSAVLGDDVAIGPGAVVGAAASIGARSVVGPNVVVGPGVVIGDDCRIIGSATLSYCLVGDRVTIHPGVRIGQDGFGFAADSAGFLSIPQLGRVIINDDVDIGANTVIDRGTSSDTVIGAGTRIDNLVHIAHNVVVGRGCALAGQVGVAGSTTIGDQVMIGGQAGINGHLMIGDGARIAAKSGVISDVPAGTSEGGYPSRPVRDWHRQTIRLDQLARTRGTKDD
jgi:UDP-3-O-[3-hydroxymyristoyl] glucosamine N-acyltransferase